MSEPWCALYSDSGRMDCEFETQKQCLQSVSGIQGLCLLNPRLARPPVPPPQRRRPDA